MKRECGDCKHPLPYGTRKKFCNTACSNRARADAKPTADDKFAKEMRGRRFENQNVSAWS